MARAPNTRYRLHIERDKWVMSGQRQRVKLREGTTITREDGSRPYIIWCARCDYYTTAMSSRGMLVYREAVKLANRHRCGQ
jgi:hypothetical protein